MYNSEVSFFSVDSGRKMPQKAFCFSRSLRFYNTLKITKMALYKIGGEVVTEAN